MQVNARRLLRIPALHSEHWLGIFVFLFSLPFHFCEGCADDRAQIRREVEDLIRHLDASTLAERSHAERRLLELGPDALPFLPAPELTESVSAREAVRRIRQQLERQAARDSSAGSRVSLEGDQTLGEILDQIRRQTRNRVAFEEAAAIKDQRIRIQWDKVLFWECLDDLCQRAQLQWHFSKDFAAIRISTRTTPQLPALAIQRMGPFRLAVNSVEVRAVVGDAKQRILRVSGRLSIEPRLRPLFLSMNAMNLKATANDDQLLEPWNPDAKYEFPVSDGGREVPIQVDFRLPAATELKTVTLQGRIHCEIAAATERVVFDQKSQTRGTIRRRGGVTVRLRHVNFEAIDADTLNGDIGVAVSYDNGGPAFESHRSWIFHNAVYLENKTAARADFTDFEMTQQADGAVAVDYRWQKIAAPATQYVFVYEAPTLIIAVPVDIDLRATIPVAE